MKRIWSIDSLRSFAILFVVIIHTNPGNGLGVTGNRIDFVLDGFARFAVPFFFLTAGYLFALKLDADSDGTYAVAYLRKLVSLYLLGILLTLPVKILFIFGQAKLHETRFSATVLTALLNIVNPGNLLYYGSAVVAPLWFLPALIYSILIILLARRVGRQRYLLLLSFLLHLIGQFGQGYSVFVSLPIDTTDALFFGLFYTVLGTRIKAWKITSTNRSTLYLTLFFGASVIQILEKYVLGYILGGAEVPDIAHGVYLFAYSPLTIIAALSLFLFALSKPTFGKDTIFPNLGHYAVGIYIIHPAVVMLLRDIVARGVEAFYGIDIMATLLWHLLFTPVVFGSSLLLYIGLIRAGVISRFFIYSNSFMTSIGKLFHGKQ